MGSTLDFDKGDNALVKLQNLELDEGEYDGDKYKKLSLVFSAVNEDDYSVEGTLPFWPTSKITISDTEEMSSSLGTMLVASGTAEKVVSQLIDDSELVNAVVNGDKRWEAETDEENEALGKALASALKGNVFRVGVTKKKGQNGEYWMIKEFYKEVDEDPFEDFDSEDVEEVEQDSDSEGEKSSDSDSDVVFGEDEEKPDEDEEFVEA